MDFLNNGDLYQKIFEHQKKGDTFTENDIWTIFIQVNQLFLFLKFIFKKKDC